MSVSLSNPSAGTIVDIARGLAANHIHGPGTYERMGLSDPAVRVLKAAVGAGSLANPAWAGDLADLHRASTEFLGKLDGQSVFAAFLDLGIIGRAPFYVSLTGASMVTVASVAGEGQPRPVSKMQLFSDRLLPMQVDCIIVLTRELMDQTSSAGQAWVYRQLRRSVAVALDAGAIPALLLGATPVTTTGDKAKDLAALLGVVNKTGQGGWHGSPVRTLATCSPRRTDRQHQPCRHQRNAGFAVGRFAGDGCRKPCPDRCGSDGWQYQ